MAKFKVGDRVVHDKDAGGADLVEHWNLFWRGDEGDVTDGTFIVTRVSGDYTSYSNRVGGRGPHVEHRYLKLAPPKIEAGKSYKTRDGRKVGPVRWDHGVNGWIVNPGDGSAWGRDGTVRNAALIRSDLVAEWIDEPAVANDNAAKVAPKFKVGDVVVDKDSDEQAIVRGVSEDRIEIEWMTAGRAYGLFGSWPLSGFKLAPSQPTAIVALIDDGVPKPATRPKVHTNQDDAAKEAERLALLYPGQEFGVFVLATSKIADTVTEMVTRAVLRAA